MRVGISGISGGGGSCVGSIREKERVDVEEE
jgi:hypothetical protein